MICLDTNIVVVALNPKPSRIGERLRLALFQGVTIGIPAIVQFELWYGIQKSARPQQNAIGLSIFMSGGVTSWPFEPEDAQEAGEIRVALERIGKPIGPYDTLIAAQARRRGAVLITTDSREFARVPGLKSEDWSQD